MKSERERIDAIRRLFAQLPTEDQVYRFWSEEFMLPVEGAKPVSYTHLAIAVALCNLVVDILYGIIDPRIRND